MQGAGWHRLDAWHLISLANEAQHDGLINRATKGAYVVGMAKQIAKERGIDLGFGPPTTGRRSRAVHGHVITASPADCGGAPVMVRDFAAHTPASKGMDLA
jgi:hypothetical protein